MSLFLESIRLNTKYLRPLVKRRFFVISVLLVLSFIIGFMWGTFQPLITQSELGHIAKPQTDSMWEMQNLLKKIRGRNTPAGVEQTEFLTRMWLGSTGKPPVVRAESLTATNWRIAGSTASADGQSLIVVYEGSNVPVSIRVGDQMPGGGKLMAISDEFASVFINFKMVYLPMRATQQ